MAPDQSDRQKTAPTNAAEKQVFGPSGRTASPIIIAGAVAVLLCLLAVVVYVVAL
jgi:hypothetical protein